MDKGTTANAIALACMVSGAVLPAGPVQAVLLTMGLFAFSGGVTNSLAVKMLFDRIPGLAGSGVIPARFREIRAKIRQLIMTHFFDREILVRYFRDHRHELQPRRYVKGGASGGGAVSSFIESHWDKMAAPEVLDPILDRQIEKLLDSSMGGLVVMVGVDNLKPTVSQFVAGIVTGMKGRLLEVAGRLDQEVKIELDEEKVADDVCLNVERLLETKLQQLDAQKVKRLLEEVIRSHLGWLVVWGTVFGGVLGLISHVVGWGR